MKQISDALLATFFPLACRICNQLVENSDCGVVCQSCWNKSSSVDLSASCQKCGYPSPSLKPITTLKDCIHCRNFPFSMARSCGTYEGALQANILELKQTPILCKNLSNLINQTLSDSGILDQVSLLIPIPLHEKRFNERTFNQSEVIAKIISESYKITLDTGSLVKVKDTLKHRLGMDKIDRNKSLKGAFEVVRPRLISEQIILLIDDVFTTGSTVASAATELLKANAKEVKVFTLARAS